MDSSSSPWSSPSARAIAIVLIPLALTALPVLIIPISGSFGVDASSPSSTRVNFFVFSLAWEPLYFTISSFVVHSFFLFSSPRLPWTWPYIVPSLLSYSGTVIYCALQGASGLDQNSSIGFASILWSWMPVALFEFAVACYLKSQERADSSVMSEASNKLLPASNIRPLTSNVGSDNISVMDDKNSAVDTTTAESNAEASFTNGNRIKQFLLSLASSINLVVTFVFTQFLLARFNSSPGAEQIGTYILFQASTFAFRWIASALAQYQVGFACKSTPNIVALHCFSQHCFFFVFYRSLFTHITSVGEFALFQAIHLIFELVQYVFLAEKSVYFMRIRYWRRCWNAVSNSIRECLCCYSVPEHEIMDQLRELSADRVEIQWHQTVQLQSVDFVARLVAMTTTWACFFVVHLLITLLPYASPHFRTLTKGGGPDFNVQQIYYLVAIVCEWSVAFVIDWFLRNRRERGESLWAIWSSLVCSTEVLILFAFIVTHITHDLFFPSLCMDFLGLEPPCTL